MVHNLGVIEEARLEPGQGLIVITGETGAGKTLLLGGLRLLLGTEARADMVGPFADVADVEGRFLTVEGEMVVGRRLAREGRSRSYLDGALASAARLGEVTAGLVEVVGQHDHLGLTRPGEVRAMIDRVLDGPGRQALSSYADAWRSLQEVEEARRRLGGDSTALARELDLARHQANEISSAGFTPGEDERLEARVSRLRHAEALREQLGGVHASLDTARDAVGEAVGELRRAARLDPSLADPASSLEILEQQLGEAGAGIRRRGEDLELTGGELEQAELRIQALGDLRRKYGATLDEVLRFGDEVTRRAAALEELVGRAEGIDGELTVATEGLQVAGADLREARAAAARRLADDATSHLGDLGLADAVVVGLVEEAPPSAGGADRARLLFASDRRLEPGEIGVVASGGELSRLVLALRLAGGALEAATLVFDEVDAGVGGRTALALGRKLSALAAGKGRQVLCVTHLPQVAAFATVHYVVERAGGTARVRRVTDDDRVEELARMLAGLPESERGREAAAELVALAQRT